MSIIRKPTHRTPFDTIVAYVMILIVSKKIVNADDIKTTMHNVGCGDRNVNEAIAEAHRMIKKHPAYFPNTMNEDELGSIADTYHTLKKLESGEPISNNCSKDYSLAKAYLIIFLIVATILGSLIGTSYYYDWIYDKVWDWDCMETHSGRQFLSVVIVAFTWITIIAVIVFRAKIPKLLYQTILKSIRFIRKSIKNIEAATRPE